MPLTLEAPAPRPRSLEALIATAVRFEPRERGFAAPICEIEELILGTERKIELVPPSAEAMRAAEAAAAIATYEARSPREASAYGSPAVVESVETLRGPSLFERMAMAARGAVRRGGHEIPPLAQMNQGAPVFLDRRAA